MGGDGNGGGGEVEIVWGGYTENAKSSQRVECRPGSSDSGGGVFLPWLWLSAWWGLYTVCLKQSPVVTKALTAGVLALGGDIAAQCFEFQQTGGTGSFAKVGKVRVARCESITSLNQRRLFTHQFYIRLFVR